MKKLARARLVTAQILVIFQLPGLLLGVLVIGLIKSLTENKRRIVFGGCGIINLSNWSRALQNKNYDSKSIVWGTPQIYPEGTFDIDLQKRWGRLAYVMAPLQFIGAVSKNDVVVCGFDGFILGTTILRSIEPHLIRIAKCKMVAIPYGGDAYVYSRVKNESLSHVLQVSYPDPARQQSKISRNVKRMIKHADFVMPGLMGFDGIGRWDVLTLNPLAIDTTIWKPTVEKHLTERMKVLHTPNHRGFKGTEFLVEAIEELQAEGLDIELFLLEKTSNETVRKILSEKIDVLVEQLVFPGYAMSGVEGLASGVVVISNLSDERIMTPMKRWSFLSECPVVSATPESIKDTLRNLYFDTSLRKQLSKCSRQYAEKYHSHDAFVQLYREIERFLYGERTHLHNYYHPLIGEFKIDEKKIVVPQKGRDINYE